MKCKIAVLLLAVFFMLVSCEEKERFPQGKVYYENFCANCHMDDGSGLEALIPPLAGADYLRDNQESLACVIRYGMEGEIVVNGQTYNNEMPGVPRLHEFEITNLINYINTAWGNDFPLVRHLDVRQKLEDCRPEWHKSQ